MLAKLDYTISKFIYDSFTINKIVEQIPYVLGIIPYDIYVIPGMFLSIFLVTLLGNPGPIQFHLLPLLFTYSIIQSLKHWISKVRPNGADDQSFPSGHTGIASALVSALCMEMNFSDNPKIFEKGITSKLVRNVISFVAIFIVFNIGLQRVINRKHSFFDVIGGYLLGISIGIISWFALEYYKKKYYNVCKNNKDDKECDNYNGFKNNKELEYWLKDWNLFNNKIIKNKNLNIILGVSRLIVCVFVLFLFIKFLKDDVWKLASIKH
jgi:membrane-associated phospholipid phosphatase